MGIGKPVTPKEHGAWLTLGVSLFTGSFAVKPESSIAWSQFALLAVASFAGFMAFTPLRRLLIPSVDSNKGRNLLWLIVYLLISAGCFFTLLFHYERMGLFWFVIPAFALTISYLRWNVAKSQKSLSVETVWMAGLALASPAASYAQQNELTAEAVFLYILMVIWFVDRAMMARKIIDSIRRKSNFGSVRAKARRYLPQFLIHLGALLLVAVVIAISKGLVPWAAFIPFLLATAKNLADTLSLKQNNDPMKAGFSEMRLGIAFALIMVAVFRIRL
ncbi:hypothetical protein MNBD_NITROSPINAE03-1410 [hydrothermal vent metagenome]|uniref:Uncharacterized protein n=1 Tax=hydrothermal vent metagenome TaxID=652676 RepID=A0A3B1BTC3_9ZZZZ